MNAGLHTPAPRLFGPWAIAAHALVFTPVVGSTLAAMNHRRLGSNAAARRTVLLFALPTAILLLAQLVVGERFSALLGVAGLVWTLAVARRLFLEHRSLFEKHVAEGGKPARWYLATFAAAGVAVALLFAVFASELLTPR